MTTMTNDQLIALAKALVEAAATKNSRLRVLGGLAILMNCSSIETHPTLQRAYGDLDFVAPRADWDALLEIFSLRGIALITKEPARWVFDKDGLVIELTVPQLNPDHRIDLSARLSLATPTVPLADLLLIKLQRKQFAAKDIKDSIALLLDHRVARGEAEDQIDHEYIAQLGARDWSLFTTVYDNTVQLEKILDQYLEPEEAQLVWRRIELLQEEMDRQPKAFGWMANQFLRRPSQVPR